MNLRRQLVGANAAITIVLLAALFLLVNFIGSRRYVRKDITSTKITELSPKTKQVLRDLKQPVKIIVFYQSSHRLFEMIQDLLDRYVTYTDKLSVEYVDPEQDRARARQIVQEHQIDLTKDPLNQIILAGGSKTKFLTDSDLADYDYRSMQTTGQPTLSAFKGEDGLTSGILGVTQATQPRVWLLSGHGEKVAEDTGPEGISDLQKLLKRENMDVESVALLSKTEIPKSVQAVVIPGPLRRFSEQELLLLQAYLQAGGRALILVDPKTNTGLDDLLARWGAELGMDIVVDPARQLPFVSAANLFVVAYTDHPIVRHMETLMTLFPLARSVRPISSTEGVESTELAVTSDDGWGERNFNAPQFKHDDDDFSGPVPIAVAIERKTAPTTRMVVIGDSDFISNDQITNVGNSDLAMATFHWLVGQEQLIGIGPKPIASIKLKVTAKQLRAIGWLGLLGLPLLLIGSGLAVWWTRRA